jgi:hypothetical protein
VGVGAVAATISGACLFPSQSRTSVNM